MEASTVPAPESTDAAPSFIEGCSCCMRGSMPVSLFEMARRREEHRAQRRAAASITQASADASVGASVEGAREGGK